MRNVKYEEALSNAAKEVYENDFESITAFELWIFKGLTLGKKIVGIKVERKDGKKFGFVDAILRDAVIKGLANMATLGILNIISLILSVVTADNKTIHDLVAKTKVENV